MLEVVQAYDYIKAGSSCPLEFSVKERDCLTDFRNPRVRFSSATNTISSISNEPEGFYAIFCLIANNTLGTVSIKNIEISQDS